MPPIEMTEEDYGIGRLNKRIDEVHVTMNEVLDALSYDRKNNRPGILPRLDNIERNQTDQSSIIKAHIEEESKVQLKVWLYDMGTYILKVLLASLALYIAASAKKGMVIDFANEAKTSVIDSILDNGSCEGCQVTRR